MPCLAMITALIRGHDNQHIAWPYEKGVSGAMQLQNFCAFESNDLICHRQAACSEATLSDFELHAPGFMG